MSWLRKVAPAICLFFLAPWVGEFLLGNIPAGQFFVLPLLAPLYGGGALLIREIARRTGRGWPTILLLGLAYGVIEAGLVDQSLFNPSFEGHDFQRVAPIPLLGISAYYAIAFIVGHAIWSIGVPIAIVEFLSPSRRTAPWLGSGGLAIVALLYCGGCAFIFLNLLDAEQFLASPGQRIGTVVAALALIGGALLFKGERQERFASRRAVPPPWLLGIGTFLAASAFFAKPENWFGVGLAVTLLALAWLLIAHWSRQEGWNRRHHFAVVTGALLTYAWGGFAVTGLFRPEDRIAWIGNALFAAVALALLLWMARVARADATIPSGDDRSHDHVAASGGDLARAGSGDD